MPSVTLSSLIGGAGVSEIAFFSGALQLSSGVSGNLIVLTPPSGKRVILNTMLAVAGNETGITITGSKAGAVVTSLTLANTTAALSGQFMIMGSYSATATSNTGMISPLAFSVDESVAISKDVGATANAINYSYAYGS